MHIYLRHHKASPEFSEDYPHLFSVCFPSPV